MRVALVYPPTCDPTAPYLSVPMLTGFLRAEGVEVLPVDANVEAYDALLRQGPMERLRERLEARLAALDGRRKLAHGDQLEYAALVRACGDAEVVPARIDDAKATLRSERFYEPEAYARAVDTIEASLGVISATHFPLHLDFTAYRTPLGLTSMEEVGRASGPDHDPFDGWVTDVLVPRLAGSDIVGVSVCFPGQLQPAYAFARRIREALPDAHITCGGPVITQMLLRLTGQRLARALGPFDSACLFEGEHTLLGLVRAIESGRPLRELPNVVVRDRLMGARWLPGHGMEDLKALPAPDFEGLPLSAYFAPTLVLPYDPTRGCYWGKCTFCHYGLAEIGTAAYRERTAETVVEHLRALGERHGTRHFYLSQDSVAPKTLVKISQGIVDAGLSVRWATDLKPEKYLTPERAEIMRRAGAVACALGVESASPRVLDLIDKGAPIEVVSDVIDHLSGAGIAAEAMCFTEFPTETHAEACETLEFLDARKEKVAVWIVGEFGLTHGALVAQTPERFGIREIFALDGDELGLGLFHVPDSEWKTDEERADLEERLSALAGGWALRSYPWAGAVSTAHTILMYDRFGPGVFRELGGARGRGVGVGSERTLHFDPRSAARAGEREAAIWAALVHEERRVGREAYERHAVQAPALRRKRVHLTMRAGAPPLVRPGRRPRHASSSARQR